MNRDVSESIDGKVTRIVLHKTQSESLRKSVLRYKGVNSSSILVMHMNQNADHSTHHRIGRTQPIPPLGDFIGE